MILLKINDDGDLEWNLDEIREMSREYDHGLRTEDTHKAKLISLIWKEGYMAAMEDVEDVQQKTLLLLGCVAGNA